LEERGVYISTYGCQMNVNDSERMLSLLEMLNYVPVLTPEQASLILINSCSVREKPVHKVHSEVGRYKKLKAKNPELRIGVAGCVASQEKQQLLKDQPLIDFVFGPDAIDQLPQLVRNAETSRLKQAAVKFDNTSPYHIETLIRHPGVSTFVNITKGCDNFCTFCVVPFTRGRERSRPLAHIIRDIQALEARGVKEVTVVGQNVNSYTSACGADFADLLQAIYHQTTIERVRFTTPHPKDFNEKLLRVIRDGRDRICEYIHLPAQSGSSEILKKMNRGYTREEYLDKVAMIRNYIPDAVLSTDIIVGFPGETEAQFEQTMSLLELVPFENVYAFAYSPRPFTKAAKMADALSEADKSVRLNRLITRHREIAFDLAQRYLGQNLQVLVEHWDIKNNKWTGRSTQNKLIHFRGGNDLVGQTVKVHIDQVFAQTLRGEWRAQ
jgi:tRNA-2-methylthio-N6-dimethylallyladenosine synthase